jgi:hypothetical protein
MRIRSFAVSIFALFLTLPLDALAQPAAVAEQHTEAVGAAEADDDIRLLLTAGASGTYGNARNIAFNLAANFQLRQGQHAFLAEASWLYGLAATRDPAAPMPNAFGPAQENTNNFNARLRYDFFITPEDAVFAVVKLRYDPFARLEPRFQGQVGYMRNLLREENHRAWIEAGYDVTYDNFGEVLDLGGGTLSNDRTLHSLRLFFGYDNHINEVLTYATGFEALMRFDRPEHWRFEWTNQFRSKIEEWLQISLDIIGRFDALPPGQVQAWDEEANQPTQMFDLTGTLNLVGTIDMYNPPAADEPEEEECTCPEPECPEPEEPAVEEPAAEEPAAEEPTEAPVEEP